MRNKTINILKEGIKGLILYLETWDCYDNAKSGWLFIMTVTKGYIDAFKNEGLLATEIEEIMGVCFSKINDISKAKSLAIDEEILDYMPEVQK